MKEFGNYFAIFVGDIDPWVGNSMKKGVFLAYLFIQDTKSLNNF